MRRLFTTTFLGVVERAEEDFPYLDSFLFRAAGSVGMGDLVYTRRTWLCWAWASVQMEAWWIEKSKGKM
jgi:hypothetical protein